VIEAHGVYDITQAPSVVLLPFFNQLFRKCGMSIPPHIDAFLRSNERF
jgi:hypothetical protein